MDLNLGDEKQKVNGFSDYSERDLTFEKLKGCFLVLIKSVLSCCF